MIKTELNMYKFKECNQSSFEQAVKKFIHSVASNFSSAVKGKSNRIKTRTEEGDAQEGKLCVISQFEAFLYGICPKNFKEGVEESIQQQLLSKVLSFLDYLLERSKSFPVEYRRGSDAALKMVGGYFLTALSAASFEY